MPIPPFQEVMLPLLGDLAHGERSGPETVGALAQHFRLTADELALRLPRGGQTKFVNRLAWAKAHLKAAGLIESPRRGVYRLTDRGQQILATRPASINMAFLSQFPEYVAFRRGTAEPADPTADRAAAVTSANDERTPDDLIDEGYRQLRTALAVDLRERIADISPPAFEQLVVDLLRAMGYGGPQEDSGIVVGRGGDEGIDGLIREDRLGLETIYVQAKRWTNTVGRPDIQRFAGALQGQRARKGVFITSSTFSSEAKDYAGSIQTTIVLIDGAQLAELMIDHDVGVTTSKRLHIKRVDSDYFDEE
jgi:restriction system protein